MKPRRDVTPYMCSHNASVNASLSLAKLWGHTRAVAPHFKPSSRYRVRLLNRLSVRRGRLGTVRP